MVAVVVLAVALALGGTLYYLATRPVPTPAPQNTPPYGLAISMSPSSGNNTTVFTFTAQASDHQDPTSAIQVRWDWENDSVWETSWSTTKTTTHGFAKPGSYTVVLEARDTANLTANVSRVVSVSLANTPPRIQGISIVPSSGTNLTSFNFTAQVTDSQDPASAIQVRWDWQDDGVWDTAWSTAKTAEHRFPVPGTYTIKVEAKDTGNLTANATTTLTVSSPPDQPPRVLGISVSPPSGNTTVTFTFTASVSDAEDPASAIQVRWDWQDDGVWDTAWSTNKVATHQFSQPGNYTVRVEALDTAGLTANGTQAVNVSARGSSLRIGTIFSLTGALSVYGQSEQNAVDMAVAEINAAGGVLGQPIVVFHMDDATNPATAATDATYLVSTAQVPVIIGTTASGMCAAVLPVAQANSVFEISPSCTSPMFSNLTYTGGWFARTAASDALEAVVAAYHALNDQGYNRSAVLAMDNVVGTQTADAFVTNFTRMGGTITPGSPRIVALGGTDYTTDLEAILDVSPMPQTVYVIEYPPDGVTIVKDWWNGIATHPSWGNVHLMFSDGVYTPLFINQLVAAGVNVTTLDGTSPAAYAGILPAGYAAWAARYAALYGSQPTLFAANAYDAAYLVALAVEASGTPTGSAIRASVRSVADPPGTVVGQDAWANATALLGAGTKVNYEGVSGSVNLNALGDVPGAMIVWGVDPSNQFYIKESFNESAVVAMLPGGFFPTVSIPPAIPLAAAWTRE